jgi:leucyl aminopeptidase
MFASLPVKITVLREKELKKENMNLFLAVNKASSSEAVMILIDYNPKKQKKVDIALVGKGLMYDSGGYYPKPAPYMNEMYGDMAGSATVVSVMQILASQKDLQKRVVGVVSLAENLIDANSYRNGDILTSRKGLTVEVTHTDAEGRLVLADTLSYVCDSFSPEILFDVATLTGSCLRSLGESYTGIISPHKDFIESFESLGETLNDRVHRLPFDPEIKSFVKSKKADLTNTEEKVGGMLGASTAGAFLSYFIDEKVKWAHFDIAGTALREKMRRSYDPQYLLGSGALVHTLAQFILGK